MNKILFLGDSGIIGENTDAFFAAYGQVGLGCADFITELALKKLQKITGKRRYLLTKERDSLARIDALMPKIEAAIKIDHFYFENPNKATDAPGQRCFLSASLSWIEIHNLSRDYIKSCLDLSESLHFTKQLKSA